MYVVIYECREILGRHFWDSIKITKQFKILITLIHTKIHSVNVKCNNIKKLNTFVN